MLSPEGLQPASDVQRHGLAFNGGIGGEDDLLHPVVAAAVLAAYEVGPLWQSLSIPGGVSGLIGFFVGWRALRKR